MAQVESVRGEAELEERQARLALDLVEPGTDDGLQAERVSRELPQGITSKMLYSDVARIAWPSLVELTLTQLTSMVDLMMVGALGPWAITAVGLSVQPRFLSMILFQAMNVGATAMVARYRGAGQPERANEVLRQALFLSLILALVCGAAGYVYSEKLIAFMGAEPETLAGGTVYLRIQMLTLPIFALTSTITAALRGVGSTRIAMFYNVLANVVNAVFNYLLIYGHFGFPRLEVAGASLATSVGQVAAFIMAAVVILRGDHYLHFSFKGGFRPHWQHLRNIFNIGVPSMLEQLAMRAGVIVYVRTVASLGTNAYATHQIGMNIQALSFMTGQAFAVSATSLVGQSLGKKRPDMAKATATTPAAWALSSPSSSVSLSFFGEQIVSLYSREPEIIAQGASILKLVALTQPAQSSQFILAGALRAGDTRATAVITFLTVMLVRPSFAMLAVNVLGLGLAGAWYALVADQLLRSGLVLLRYRSGRWKNVRIK